MIRIKKFLPIILIIIVISPFFISLIRPGFFSMFDDMQVVRVFEMNKCILDLQIPCRWVSGLGYGYGYPLFSFYSPLPYYFMELFHLLNTSFIDVVKIGFVSSVLFSGIFFYLLVRKFFSLPAAIFSTIIYVYAPFRASELFVRGAMGELWGMFSFPFILWAFESFLDKKNKLLEFIFVISILIYLTSHNLTVLMTLPVVVGWMVIRLYLHKTKRKDILLFLFLSFLGVAISAFFWLPVIFEAKLVHIETLTEGYFNFLAHFLSIKQIFLSTHWGYGPSVSGSLDDVFLGLGPIATLGIVSGALGIIKNKKMRIMSIFLFICLFFSIFLTHSKSTFIWNALPFLQILQFPWRFMVVAIFAASILAGVFVTNLGRKASWFMVFLVGILTILIYGSFYQPKDWFMITDTQKLSGESYTKQITASIYDYLPKSAKVAPDGPAPDRLIAIDGIVETLDFEKGSNWFKISAQTEKGAEVAVPVYDFPLWEVKVNDEVVQSSVYGELGLVSFKLPAGKSNIQVHLKNPLINLLANLISLIGIAVLVYFLLHEKVSSKFFKK